MTWDVAPKGLIAIARSHAELIAGGLAVSLESRFRQDATILGTLTLSSFAGIATTLVPWLLTGGTLLLHQPFDASTFVTQQRSMDVDVVVLPGPLISLLADAGCLNDRSSLDCVVGIWRAPERLPRVITWPHREIGVADVQVFGEVGLIPVRRGSTGRPGLRVLGATSAQRGARDGLPVCEIAPTSEGTVGLRGPMVPRRPFPPGIEWTTRPHLKIDANGFVDTGYACWTDHGSGPLIVTGPPSGLVSVGGYRFVMRELQEIVAAVDPTATVAALPDPYSGHRLAAAAFDPTRVQHSLAARGVNPLLVDAFVVRDPRPAAARDA
jgi:hypothetical protein